jgi:hypothetical protein
VNGHEHYTDQVKGNAVTISVALYKKYKNNMLVAYK